LTAGGTYTIDGSSCLGLIESDPTDYAISYTGGTFTVRQAKIQVSVTGSQTYGGSPSFTPTYTTPPGTHITGTATCTTVNGGTPITGTLATGGTYTIDGSSCSGLRESDSTDYAISYMGGAFTVSIATPVVHLTETPSPATLGTITYRVTVTGAGATPTGSVSVSDGTRSCNIAALNGSGNGSCAFGEPAGTHSVKATYSGNANYVTASATLSVSVARATPTVHLTASANPAVHGYVTYAVAVSGVAGFGVNGTATISDGSRTCTATINSRTEIGSCRINEPTGTYTISALYNSSSNYNPKTVTIREVVNS
jgi:hypothetical protein